MRNIFYCYFYYYTFRWEIFLIFIWEKKSHSPCFLLHSCDSGVRSVSLLMPLLGSWTTQGFPHQPPLPEPQGPGHQVEKLSWGKSSTPHSVLFQKLLFPPGAGHHSRAKLLFKKVSFCVMDFLIFIFFFPLGVWVFGVFRGVLFSGGCLGIFGWTLRRFFFFFFL